MDSERVRIQRVVSERNHLQWMDNEIINLQRMFLRPKMSEKTSVAGVFSPQNGSNFNLRFCFGFRSFVSPLLCFLFYDYTWFIVMIHC